MLVHDFLPCTSMINTKNLEKRHIAFSGIEVILQAIRKQALTISRLDIAFSSCQNGQEDDLRDIYL